MAMTTDEWIDELKAISVLELSERIKALEETFGASAVAAPVAVAAAPSAGTDDVEEQTSFTVTLEAAGEKKIQVIKVVRAVTGLGLKEAKDLVDGAPAAVKEGVAKEEAEQIKTQIQDAGGTVSVA